MRLRIGMRHAFRYVLFAAFILLVVGAYCLRNFDRNSFAVNGGVVINEDNFPDAEFRRLIAESFDVDMDGKLDDGELSDVDDLRAEFMGIKDVSGIEFFHNLVYLFLEGNDIISIDLSHNPKLRYLYIEDNELSSIDVSENRLIKDIFVSDNHLTSIDVTHNPELECLDLGLNRLDSIDVSHNPELQVLELGGSDLLSVDVSHNSKLTALIVSNSRLKSIDVSENPDLEVLRADGNRLSSVDVSRNPKLAILDVGSNDLTSIDISRNLKLTDFSISANQLDSVDVSQHSELEWLDIRGNRLSSIDVSQNHKLWHLEADGNIAQLNSHLLTEPDFPGKFDFAKVSSINGAVMRGDRIEVGENSVFSYQYETGSERFPVVDFVVEINDHVSGADVPGIGVGDKEYFRVRGNVLTIALIGLVFIVIFGVIALRR